MIPTPNAESSTKATSSISDPFRPRGRTARSRGRRSRKLAVLGLVLAVAGLASAPARGAEHTVQARPDNTFSPASLTIQAGDTVTWMNAGGFHNVAASDGSFRCAQGCDGQGGSGDPSTAAWSFSLTFTEVGTIDYVCEVHVALGMTGSITVEGGPPPEAGDLRLATASQQRSEAAGSFSVQVQRVNGSDGAVSVEYSTSDGSAAAGSDYSAASGTVNWPDGDAAPRTIEVSILNDSEEEANESLALMLSNPSGGAGLGSPSAATLTITDDDVPDDLPGQLGFSAESFSGAENAGGVSVEVRRTGGSDGTVGVSYSTSDGSAEAGSDYQATLGTLSWQDGDTAPKTFEVTLVDDAVEEGAETVNLLLSDPTGGAGLGTAAATLTVLDDDATGTCVADADTLCLGKEDRFRAEIAWRDFDGNSDAGRTVEIGRRDSGLFYFFDENNIEMLLKVLDGCAINDRFWVFFAATTDVEFDLTVTDTLSGAPKSYRNLLGEPAQPVLDVEAFAACP